MGLIGNLRGTTGSAGTNGTNGTDGTPGAKWYFGSGAPDDGTGIDGDFYLETDNGNVYTKAGGTWA